MIVFGSSAEKSPRSIAGVGTVIRFGCPSLSLYPS
jgi:hypothetical protein